MNKTTIIGLVLAIFAAVIVSDVGGFPLDKKASFLKDDVSVGLAMLPM